MLKGKWYVILTDINGVATVLWMLRTMKGGWGGLSPPEARGICWFHLCHVIWNKTLFPLFIGYINRQKQKIYCEICFIRGGPIFVGRPIHEIKATTKYDPFWYDYATPPTHALCPILGMYCHIILCSCPFCVVKKGICMVSITLGIPAIIFNIHVHTVPFYLL